jgi:Protein of unknown function (DUF1153)
MMLMTSPAPVRRVLAPDGSVLTLADLPRPDAQRWVASRKAIVVAAVRGGLLSMSDACARYRLTTEEFLSWQTQVDRNGLKGLRATRVQDYRGSGRRTHGHDVRGADPRSEGGQQLQPRTPWLSGRRSHSGYGLGLSNPDRVV